MKKALIVVFLSVFMVGCSGKEKQGQQAVETGQPVIEDSTNEAIKAGGYELVDKERQDTSSNYTERKISAADQINLDTMLDDIMEATNEN